MKSTAATATSGGSLLVMARRAGGARVISKGSAGSVTSLIEQGAHRVGSSHDITPCSGSTRLDQCVNGLLVGEHLDGLLQLLEETIGPNIGHVLMITSDETDHTTTRDRTERLAPEVRAISQLLQGDLVRRFAHLSSLRRLDPARYLSSECWDLSERVRGAAAPAGSPARGSACSAASAATRQAPPAGSNRTAAAVRRTRSPPPAGPE